VAVDARRCRLHGGAAGAAQEAIDGHRPARLSRVEHEQRRVMAQQLRRRRAGRGHGRVHHRGSREHTQKAGEEKTLHQI